ncbi:hypothetical protein G7054_g13931 [Neopestalotiopsis clavispora]|nr:hypothetical protein G7054_g13931 [Neopestalotiopsis clavispora]
MRCSHFLGLGVLLSDTLVTHAASIPTSIVSLPRDQDTTTTDLVERDPAVYATSRGAAYSWQSVARGCVEVKEQDTVGKKVFKAVWDCGLGAIAGIIMGGIAGAGAVAVANTAGPPLKEYLHSLVNRRSFEDLDAVGAQGADHFSEQFGLNVRHLGHWNDTVTSQALQKRDSTGAPEGVLRPVWGYTSPQGQDLHFSLIDHDEANGTTFRFGFGEQGESLAKRGPSDWFQGVGFDYKYLNRMPAITNMNWHDDNMFAFLYDQLYCMMHSDFDYSKMESNQIYFQIYDHTLQGTRASANLAAFGFNQHSYIEEMGDYKSSINPDYRCYDYAGGAN